MFAWLVTRLMRTALNAEPINIKISVGQLAAEKRTPVHKSASSCPRYDNDADSSYRSVLFMTHGLSVGINTDTPFTIRSVIHGSGPVRSDGDARQNSGVCGTEQTARPDSNIDQMWRERALPVGMLGAELAQNGSLPEPDFVFHLNYCS